MKRYVLTRNPVGVVLLALVLNSVPLLADKPSIPPPARPTEVQDEQTSPRYDLNIVDGYLLLDARKDFPTLSSRLGAKVRKVDASLDNIVDVLRDLHTNANIILSPGLAKIKIGELKIRANDNGGDDQLLEALAALSIASGDKFLSSRVNDGSQINPLTGQTMRRPGLSFYSLRATTPATHRSVEVFNISGYIHHLSGQSAGTNEIQGNLEKIGGIINDTVRKVETDDFNGEDFATLEYHPGSNLLIVVGDSVSLDIARKVLNALLGQGTETRNILIMGAVLKPGSVTLPAEGKMTIIDAIGLAGGTTKLANERKIEFTRNGKSEIYSFENLKKMTDQKQVIYLEPGDIIKVHETFL